MTCTALPPLAPVVRRRFALLTAGGTLALLAALDLALFVALRIAGRLGTPPPAASVFQTFISMFSQEAPWLIVTGLGLVLVLVAGMMALPAALDLGHPSLKSAGLVGLVLILGAGIMVLLAAVDLRLLAGLKAAGLVGAPPPGATVFQALIGTLTQNALWLIVTGVGLVLTLVAGMMAFGSQRAPDVLFRVIAAIALILIAIPAVLA